MANYIMEHGKTTPNIFLSSGNAHSQRAIREKFDTNVPLIAGEDDVLTVAFVLMDFLQTLLTPILPINILNQIVSQYETEGDRNENVVQSIFYSLPKDNSMCFVYLLSFFREMLSCSDKNKLTPEKISEILCECLVGEDKLAKSNSHNFRRDNLVRADTPLGKRRVTTQVSSPGKSRPSATRKNPHMMMRLSQQANAMDDHGGSPYGEDADEEVGEDEVQNLSVEQLKSKLRY
jgi:hypothetical protein